MERKPRTQKGDRKGRVVGQPKQRKQVKSTEPPKRKQVKKATPALQVVKSPRDTTANGVRKNVMVYCDIDKLAAECIPVGVLTKALSQGFSNTPTSQIYWAYWAFMKDIIAIVANQTSLVFGRLEYLNRILASLMPKSVDGLKTREVAYSWRNTDTLGYQTPVITIRGKNVYWYVPSSTVDGPWRLQVPPSNPSTEEEANTTLALAYSVIAGDKTTNPNLEYQPGQSLKPDYKKDVSCFASVSPYYGQSAGDSSSSFSSAECEVPYKSQILACLTSFQNGGDRVSRFFHCSSGGSVEAFSFGLIPEMKREFYNTVYPVVYKYIDFDEVYTFLVEWYAALTSKAAYDYKNGTLPANNNVVVALTPMPCTAQQFALMVRQMILSRFVVQTNVQTNTYSLDQYGFEPFRCGTNCYPRQYESSIYVPTVLNENLNALLPRFYNMHTNYSSNKNAYITMPVWGTYKSWNPSNPTIQVLEAEYNQLVESPLFQAPISADPNLWDGLNGNSNVCDLINSPLIVELSREWNSRIGALLQYSSTVAFLGGESNGALLLHTRYANYPPAPKRYMDTILPMARNTIPRECIEEEKVDIKPIMQRSKSDTPVPKVREIYVPKDGSLLTQKTTAYAATSRITNAEKEIYSYLILPTIVVEATKPPYQRQARVAYVEPYVLDMTQDDTSVGGRYAQIKQLAQLCAAGTAAAQTSALTQVVDYLTRKGQGGFIGDVLSVLAKEIPI